MAKKEQKNLFSRLTRLFKSGPVVKKKIRGIDSTVADADRSKSSGTMLFQKSSSATYATITSSAYNLSERMMRYQDYQTMEYTPEIASALDIYADETVSQDDKGKILHVYSENEKIKQILDDLFSNILNFEFNGRSWVRNLVKYGDLFLFIDVSKSHGVVNAFPIPVNEIEREENYDRDDPFAVRFRWVTMGNRVLEHWEVAHFRLLGNDVFLPYGSSVIEPARRIWRQLILIEDAMLVYRVVRAPERRVFYIDVANLPPENVSMYVEEQRKNLRSSSVIDSSTGRVDLRYNPMSVDEDYFIPVRGSDTGTRIDTLAGGQNAAAVEDVAYIQKKLFAALKIPRAYLGYDEMVSSKATLAQEDIRFSRTIAVIQKTLIAELNKIAIIHLYAHGFDGEDLQNFTLRLSNPSTVAQQQKLELWRAKFEIAGAVPENFASVEFVQKEIWGISSEQIDVINKQRLREKLLNATIEAASAETDAADSSAGGADLFSDDGGGGDTGGDELEEPAGDDLPPEENAGETPVEDVEDDVELLTSSDDLDDDEDFAVKLKSLEKQGDVIKKNNYNRSRRRTHGASKTHMPDFVKMTGNDTREMNDPNDNEWMKSIVSNPFAESKRYTESIYHGFSPDMWSVLRGMSGAFGYSSVGNNTLISENVDVQDEIDSASEAYVPSDELPVDREDFDIDIVDAVFDDEEE